MNELAIGLITAALVGGGTGVAAGLIWWRLHPDQRPNWLWRQLHPGQRPS